MTGAAERFRPRTTRSLAIATTRRDTSSALSPVVAIERLRMAQERFHEPVLATEIVELFASQPAGVVVDATLGGAGHAEALLRAAPQLRILGIDRDPGGAERSAHATWRLRRSGPRREGDLRRTRDVLGAPRGLRRWRRCRRHLDGPRRVVAPVGRDRPRASRFAPTPRSTCAWTRRRAKPLPSCSSRIDQHELARLLRAHGEGRFAGAIAKSIHERQPRTTNELSEAVERAVPKAARRRGHVATRVFQALRVAVNAEEGQLDEGLVAALDALSVGGVLAVISYHSGEDRTVKAFFAEQQSGGCHCPPELGCVCGAISRVHVFKASAQLASAHEIAENPRARSARLRIARKVSQ